MSRNSIALLLASLLLLCATIFNGKVVSGNIYTTAPEHEPQESRDPSFLLNVRGEEEVGDGCH